MTSLRGPGERNFNAVSHKPKLTGTDWIELNWCARWFMGYGIKISFPRPLQWRHRSPGSEKAVNSNVGNATSSHTGSLSWVLEVFLSRAPGCFGVVRRLACSRRSDRRARQSDGRERVILPSIFFLRVLLSERLEQADVTSGARNRKPRMKSLLRNGPLENLWGTGEVQKKYSRKEKFNKKNLCTPINPKKYSCYGPKN